MTKIVKPQSLLNARKAINFNEEKNLPKTDDRISSLRDLAAFHLIYGRVESAASFLQIALWINPNDGKSLRLNAHVEARRGNASLSAKTLMSAARSQGVTLQLGDWKVVGHALLRQGHEKLGLQFLTRKSAALTEKRSS